MKIGILTYYGVHNHGAVLQANGLQQVLLGMGHDVSFLTFERSYEYISKEMTHKYKISLNSIPFYWNYMFQKGLGNILYNFKKRGILKKYRNTSLKMGVPYDAFDGDVVIIGSDEVFSIEVGYNQMMYGYNLKPKHIVSYAGSFGPTTIKEIENKGKTTCIRDGLNTFDAISVRDMNSHDIIEQLCNLEVSLVCDPVILYGYDKEKLEFKPKETNYIVVYAYDNRMNDPEEVRAVIEFARAHNYKVYSVGYYHKWCDKSINATPSQLLGWIKNAELTITDTFHGSVMSIICGTPMAVKVRDNANKLTYLLAEYGLSERIMNSFDELDKVSEKIIDFDKVNNRLNEVRKKSFHFLMSAIEV